MKVAELEGAELDYWVARVLGYDAVLHEMWPVENRPTVVIHDPRPERKARLKVFRPTEDWLEGGQIIENKKIGLTPYGYEWSASLIKYEYRKHVAKTALVAAMRALVASEFGNEVESE